MNLLKKLRDELANKIASAAADIAENSVDHCDAKGKEAIKALVKEEAQKLLDPQDTENPIPTDPNEPLIFRSKDKKNPFTVDIKGFGSVWDEIQKHKDIDKALLEKAEIRVGWEFKF